MASVMMIALILQIIFRYVVREPLGWTLEACLMAWLWTVFWGSAFLVKDHNHVKFDLVYLLVPSGVRRVFAIISAIAIASAFVVSFPQMWDYISFMKIESSSVLKIRLDYVFSIYAIFAVAIIVRYVWRAIDLLRGGDPQGDLTDPLAAHADDPTIE
jgi:TRAP-type C4-dicarboxylate transport system permease small subunit